MCSLHGDLEERCQRKGQGMKGKPMERVVIEDAMMTRIRLIRESHIHAEVAGYEGQRHGDWKTASAQAFFDTNSIELPAALLQKLEWAQSQLAAAEGAVLEWMLNNQIDYGRAISLVSKYQKERERAKAK